MKLLSFLTVFVGLAPALPTAFPNSLPSPSPSIFDDSELFDRSGSSDAPSYDSATSFSSSNSSNPHIYRRWNGSPASVTLWEEARCKGEKFLKAMADDDATAGRDIYGSNSAASPWTKVNDFSRWAWTVDGKYNGIPKCDLGQGKNTYGLEPVLNTLGVSTVKKDWECLQILHGNTRDVVPFDEQVYRDPSNPNRILRTTGSRFVFAMNPKAGVIIISQQFSPQHAAQYRRPPVPADQFPALRLTSDIAWLAWYALGRENSNNLRYIITWSVTNAWSQMIIRSAIGHERPNDLNKWPWLSWESGSDQGKALLGSPNGVGIAYFLIQHKAVLGDLIVRRVHVFLAETQPDLYEPSILWELAVAPQG